MTWHTVVCRGNPTAPSMVVSTTVALACRGGVTVVRIMVCRRGFRCTPVTCRGDAKAYFMDVFMASASALCIETMIDGKPWQALWQTTAVQREPRLRTTVRTTVTPTACHDNSLHHIARPTASREKDRHSIPYPVPWQCSHNAVASVYHGMPRPTTACHRIGRRGHDNPRHSSACPDISRAAIACRSRRRAAPHDKARHACLAIAVPPVVHEQPRHASARNEDSRQYHAMTKQLRHVTAYPRHITVSRGVL